MTLTKKKFPSKRYRNENDLSKNHSHSVKYRKRILEEKEAKQEIKEFIPVDIPHNNAS